VLPFNEILELADVIMTLEDSWIMMDVRLTAKA
jgi:hypothetical protein